MDLALLVLRLVVGAFFVGHGAQKLWGSFGGHGLAGTGQFFESLGIRPGRRNAQLAGTSELLGGVLLALGLLTPLAAVMIISVMTVAVLTVHAKNGPWSTEGGYEYNAVLMAAAFVVAANPGDWSLDAALGFGKLHGTAFALGALVVGVIGGIVTASGRKIEAPAKGDAEPGDAPADATQPETATDLPAGTDTADRDARIRRDVATGTGTGRTTDSGA